MAVRVYATANDYREFIGEAIIDEPELDEDPSEGDESHEEDASTDQTAEDRELNALLRRASISVDGYTRTARYSTDEDGYPTDPDIAEAFKLATCAQAAWFIDSDDVTGSASQDGSVTIGSVSIGARGRTAGSGAPDAAASRFAPEAIDILRNAGLLSPSVRHP